MLLFVQANNCMIYQMKHNFASLLIDNIYLLFTTVHLVSTKNGCISWKGWR